MHKRILSTIALLLAVAILPVASVAAQEATVAQEEPRTGLGNVLQQAREVSRQDRIQTAREAFALTACERIIENLTTRHESIEATTERHTRAFENAEQKINAVILHANERAVDATDLQSVFETFATHFDTYRTARAALESRLDALTVQDCQSPESVITEIADSRSELEALRDSAQQTRQSLHVEALPAARALIETIRTQGEDA